MPLSRSVELAEVSPDDPGSRLVPVAPLGPLEGESPHVGVQRVEHLGGHHAPVIGRPAADNGVERGDDRPRVAAAQGAHLGCEPFPEPSDGRLGRLDQQLVLIAADVEPEKVEALAFSELDLHGCEGRVPTAQCVGLAVGIPSSTVVRERRSSWASLSSAPARLTLRPSTSPSQPSCSASAMRAIRLSRISTMRAC